MKKSKVVMILLIIAISVSLFGCDNTEPVEQEKELIVMQGVDATTLDPAMHSDGPSGNVCHQIFDTILKRDVDMNIIAGIAKTWEMKDDLTWEFTIHDDILFHDGNLLTTEDVKFSFDRIVNPENTSPRLSHYDFIEEIIIIDDFNFQVKTKEPAPVLLSRLVALQVVPEHYITEVGNSKFAMEPVGSGPYKFEAWVKDERIVLTVNEDYFLDVPEIKKVVFKPVPEASSRVMALQAEEADIISNLPPNNIEQIETIGSVAEVASTRVIFLAFTTANEAVNDVRVRQALELAVDNKSIVDNIFSGKATVSSQIISVFDLGFNDEIENRNQDKEKAIEILNSLGKQDLEITLKSPAGRYVMDKEVAEAVAAQIESIGVKVNLVFEDFNSYVTKIINGTMDADLWLIGWGSSTFDAGTTLMQWLHTNNKTSYYRVEEETNIKIDNLLDDALVTVNDDVRELIYKEIIKQTVEDVAFINLYQQNDLYGVSSRVNFVPRGDELIDIYATTWK